MNVGGYVSFTADGYKCIAFGDDKIYRTINRDSADFDIPQLFALRVGRKGFRRSTLTTGDAAAVIYSAFVGVAEPAVSRPGSFLAIGLAFEEDIDCKEASMGDALSSLLLDLLERVANSQKLTREITAEVVNDFLTRNLPVLDDIRKLAYSTRRTLLPKSNEVPVLLSDEATTLQKSFNSVCATISPSSDFFLFDIVAAKELQGAKHEPFRLSQWPIRAASVDIKGTIPVAKTNDEKVGHNPVYEFDRRSPLIPNEHLERFERKIDAILAQWKEDEFSVWKFGGTIAVACSFALSIAFFATGWFSFREMSRQLVAQEETIKSLQSDLSRLPTKMTSVTSAPPPKGPIPDQTTDPLVITLQTNSTATVILQFYCGNLMATKAEIPKLLEQFTKLNSDRALSADGKYKRGQPIRLFPNCIKE